MVWRRQTQHIDLHKLEGGQGACTDPGSSLIHHSMAVRRAVRCVPPACAMQLWWQKDCRPAAMILLYAKLPITHVQSHKEGPRAVPVFQYTYGGYVFYWCPSSCRDAHLHACEPWRRP